MNKTLGPFITIDKTGIEPNKYPHELFDYFSLPAYDSGKSQETVFGREIDSNKFLIKANTILVSKLNPRTKRVWLVTGNFTKRIVASTEFIPIVCDEGVDTEFLAQSMLQDDVYRVFQANAVGTTNSHVRFPPSLVEKIELFIPAIIEQQKTAKILNTVDNLIDQTQNLIDKYTDVKQGMMADLFSRGIDLSGTPETNKNYGQLRPSYEEAPELYQETELGWIPKDWEIQRVEDILDRVIDYRGKTPNKTGDGIPLITAKNVRFGYIDPEPREYIAAEDYDVWMTRGIPNQGDVLFTTEAPLANVAQLDTQSKVAFAQRMIILQSSLKCDSSFLKYLLMSDNFRRAIFSRGSGSTVEGVKQSEFKKVKVCLPKHNCEQIKIVEVIDSLSEKIVNEEIIIEKYTNIKKGLMQDLLTGKVKV